MVSSAKKRRYGNPAKVAGPKVAGSKEAGPKVVGPKSTRPQPVSSGSRAVAVTADEADAFLPPEGATYPQVLRTDGYVWWRSLLGVAMAISLFLLLSSVVSQAVVALFWALTANSTPYVGYVRSAFAFERPSGLLGANLGIAAAIPIAYAMIAIFHRVQPRWLSSVQPRLRRRYLLVCLGVALVALNGVLVLSSLASPAPSFGAQRGFWGFLAVIVLTSPLQAAAEEVLFRGYLMQALGSLVARPWFGIVVSSVVFALLHGSQNLPLFLDRLAFGLLAAVLVWRTGGIEAGVAAHVVNNVFAYLIAGLTTSIAAIRAVQQITWGNALVDVGGFALFALLAYLVARRMRLRTRVSLTGAADGELVPGLSKGPDLQ